MKTIGKIIILLLLPLTALEVNAQDDLYMNIIQKDGSVVRVPVNDIQEVKIDKASYNPRPLNINVSDQPLEDNAHAAGAMRRIPPTTTNTLNKFYLNYVYGNVVGEPELYTYNVENGEWLVGTTTNPGAGGWPDRAKDATPVTFYAYANVDVNTEDYDNNLFFLDSDGPCISFGMDEYTRELNDLLVAQATDSWDNCGGHLFLPFEHACAALEFYISKTASLDDYTIDVSNVKIHNVPSVGVYYFNSGEWMVIPDEEYLEKYTVYALNNDAITVKKDADGKDLLIGEGDYMFVIPQTLTPWDKSGSTLNSTGTYIEITCKISKEGEYVVGGEGEDEDDWGKAYLPFEATLTKGKIHPFTIKMGTALRDASGNKIFQ